MSLVPNVNEFREAVDGILGLRDSLLVKTMYLTAARVSEVITKALPWELKHNQSKGYGQYMRWTLQDYQEGKIKEKVLLLTMAVAKRSMRAKGHKGKVLSEKQRKKMVYKIVALPTSQKYEPWTIDLLKYLRKRGALTFDITRQWVNKLVKQNLRELDPTVHSHSLRHWRITHLVSHNGFDPYDITAFSGWTFKTTFGGMGMGSGQLDTYLHLAWRKYFPKLLRTA
jgi:integrase